MASQFPLSNKITRPQRQRLAKILWSWNICPKCLAGKDCNPHADDCSWYRSDALTSYFRLYETKTRSYRSDVKSDERPGLSSHEDLFDILEKLKSSPDVKRADLVQHIFTERPVRSDQERAVDLAVRIMFMIDCSTSRRDSVLIESGVHHFPWRNEVTLSEFVESLFTKQPHPGIGRIKKNLKAVKLKKLASIAFEPTDDIRCHLEFDYKKAAVKIFHHAAFLKEQLRLTINESPSMTVSEYIRLGALPRALALEILNSTQTLLFPLTDSKSKAVLKSLTSADGVDEDILVWEFDTLCNPDENPNESAAYEYFTTELGDLYEEQSNPTLRGAQKWWEKKSGARYVMMVTVAGIVFAFLSLGLAGFQSWIGWQQWQHPVGGN